MLDFKTAEGVQFPEVVNLLGNPKPFETNDEYGKVSALDKALDSSILSNWAIVSNALIAGAGLNFVTKCSTLGQLAASHRYYDIDGALIQLLVDQGMSEEDFVKFIQLRSGSQLKKLEKPVEKKSLAFAVFSN